MEGGHGVARFSRDFPRVFAEPLLLVLDRVEIKKLVL
jgi:hypothetical protein